MAKKSKKKQPLDKIVEAILFVQGEPISIRQLSRLAGTTESKTRKAVETLSDRLAGGSALRVLASKDSVQLVTAKEYAPIIEKAFKKEHREDLTRAALEVLAIVAYRGPVARSDIERIRGVNSAYTIRNLLLRGLIEEADSDKKIYDLSFAASREFGLESREDLPEWHTVQANINQAEQALTNNEINSNS